MRSALQGLSTTNHLIKVYFSQDGNIPPGVLDYTPPVLPLTDDTMPLGTLNMNGSFVITTSNNTNITPTSVCDVNSQQIAIIHFIATPSSLPPLHVDKSQLIDNYHSQGLGSGVVNIYSGGAGVLGYTSIIGTTENAVCNNRGMSYSPLIRTLYFMPCILNIIFCVNILSSYILYTLYLTYIMFPQL